MRDKIKSLSKDTLIYGTSTVIQRFLAFILVPLYTNIFSPSEFGIQANLFAYIAILNVFFSIGFESGYFKFASTLEIGDKKDNFSLPYFSIFINSFILSAVLFIFPVNLAPLFQLAPERAPILLRYSALILFFDAAVLIPFAYLRLRRRAKVFGTLKVLSITINVSLNILFLLVFRWGIEAIFLANAIASGVTFIIFLPLIFKNLTFRFNKQLYKEILKFSIPLIPAGIGANLVQVIDRPILRYLTNEQTVGIYQANYRMGILMMLFCSIYEFAWRPFFLQTAKEPNAKQIFSKIMTLFIFAACVLFLFFSFYIENIVKIPLPFKGYLLGKAYWSGLYIVPIVLAGYLFYGIYINLMAGIYIEKKTKYLPLITGIGAAMNIIVNFALIPKFGITGAAYATLFSYLAMMIGIYMITKKFYKVDYEFSKIYLIFFSTIATFIIYSFTAGTFLHEWYFKILYIVLFFVLIFAFKIITLNDIKSLRGIKKPAKQIVPDEL
ncbi:MAG: oligosaccharide flippase family protein [Bacteroidetes bacterium]|nr:oligosaccharide flippase family protein [Bacteroidota bacterium]